jgi:hypothetical protein
MFFWRILEPCLVVLSVLLVFTQVIFPAFMDRPLFPLFRKSNKKLNQAVEDYKDLNVQEELKELEHLINEKKKLLEREEKENGKQV